MEIKEILLIACFALLLHDAACVEKIGDYELGEILGTGNFGEVRLGINTKAGKNNVAIKIIDPTKFTDEVLKKNVHNEAKIMKMLKHPNIVKLFEEIDMKEKLYLLMEYESGGDMYKYLENLEEEMDETEVRAKFQQTVSAVEYCHKNGIAHRDLKTANLLLDINGNIKLTDFGFATEFKPGQKFKDDFGTGEYMAPEMHKLEDYEGPEVDVWSLGTILYEFATGAQLFYGYTSDEKKDKVLSSKFSVSDFEKEGISHELADLISKILVKEPNGRFTIEKIKDHTWMKMRNDQHQLKPPALKRPRTTSSSPDPAAAPIHENKKHIKP